MAELANNVQQQSSTATDPSDAQEKPLETTQQDEQIIESNWDEAVATFDDMELDEKLLRGIYAYGFEKPSAIQQRGIIPILKGYDSIAQAQSLYNSSSGSNPATALGEDPDYWYKFDVSNGTTTIPNSGGAGGNNLTLTNFSGTYILEH